MYGLRYNILSSVADHVVTLTASFIAKLTLFNPSLEVN